MNIKIGEFYVNKTWRFLMPCLQGYGESFVSRFNPIFKLGVGIHDTIVENTPIANGSNIFILCDRKYLEKTFDIFLAWVKTQDYYVTDYCPDINFEKSRKLMLVLKIPKEFEKSYQHFLKGEYSKMYSIEHLNTLFLSVPSRLKEYKILTLDNSLKEEFIQSINTEFGTTMRNFDEPVKELELPLVLEEEVFGSPVKNRHYFEVALDKK